MFEKNYHRPARGAGNVRRPRVDRYDQPALLKNGRPLREGQVADHRIGYAAHPHGARFRERVHSVGDDDGLCEPAQGGDQLQHACERAAMPEPAQAEVKSDGALRYVRHGAAVFGIDANDQIARRLRAAGQADEIQHLIDFVRHPHVRPPFAQFRVGSRNTELG